jgi:hypothetical protein
MNSLLATDPYDSDIRILIDSKNAEYNVNTHEYSFHLGLEAPDATHFILFRAISAQFPNSFYQINESNNILSVNTEDYFIEMGNYNVFELRDYINSIQDIFTMSYNKRTAKYTLTGPNPFTLIGSNCLSLIGFSENNSEIFETPKISDITVNLKPIDTLLVFTNLTTETYFIDGRTEENNLLLSQFVDKDYGNYLYYTDSHTEFFNNSYRMFIDRFVIRVEDINSNPINFRGNDFSIFLQFRFHKYVNQIDNL